MHSLHFFRNNLIFLRPIPDQFLQKTIYHINRRIKANIRLKKQPLLFPVFRHQPKSFFHGLPWIFKTNFFSSIFNSSRLSGRQAEQAFHCFASARAYQSGNSQYFSFFQVKTYLLYLISIGQICHFQHNFIYNMIRLGIIVGQIPSHHHADQLCPFRFLCNDAAYILAVPQYRNSVRNII